MINGTIKRFNPNKGYGFIISKSLPSDVFLHNDIVPDEVVAYLRDGVEVLFEYEERERGLNCTRVDLVDKWHIIVLPEQAQTERGEVFEVVAENRVNGEVKFFHNVEHFRWWITLDKHRKEVSNGRKPSG